MAEIITMKDIRKMYEDSEDRFYVVYEYLKEHGRDFADLSEEEDLDIYKELYPMHEFLKDYYDSIFYGGDCEPDEDVYTYYMDCCFDERTDQT